MKFGRYTIGLWDCDTQDFVYWGECQGFGGLRSLLRLLYSAGWDTISIYVEKQ